MLYHITYTDRYTGKTEVGRVGVCRAADAASTRRGAINAAAFKYPSARRATISAVAIPSRTGL